MQSGQTVLFLEKKIIVLCCVGHQFSTAKEDNKSLGNSFQMHFKILVLYYDSITMKLIIKIAIFMH